LELSEITWIRALITIPTTIPPHTHTDQATPATIVTPIPTTATELIQKAISITHLEVHGIVTVFKKMELAQKLHMTILTRIAIRIDHLAQRYFSGTTASMHGIKLEVCIQAKVALGIHQV
jgi:phosphoribosylaminoimidazole-succinocarboxamide synthase